MENPEVLNAMVMERMAELDPEKLKYLEEMVRELGYTEVQAFAVVAFLDSMTLLGKLDMLDENNVSAIIQITQLCVSSKLAGGSATLIQAPFVPVSTNTKEMN